MSLRRAPLALVLALSAPAAGCGPGDEPDSVAQDVVDADDAGVGPAESCLPEAAPEEQRGVLALVNDEDVDAAALRALGLGAKSAAGIVANRPYADIDALDAVPWVGAWTCGQLEREACDRRGLCERELSLWTWNIEHFPLSSSAVDKVATTLLDEQVELVGFEEVDSLSAFDELLEQLPGWEGIQGSTGFDTRVAIAYRTDRMQPTSVEHLFEDDSYRFPRPALAVTFDVPGRAATGELTLVVVHLKAQIDAESQERRREALIVLEQWMYERRVAGEGTIIAVGDYNDDIDDETADNVFWPFLSRQDRYVALTLPAAERGEYSYIPFKRLIDHMIATRQAAEQFSALSAETVPLEQSIPSYTNTVSDHRPVRAQLVPVIPAP